MSANKTEDLVKNAINIDLGNGFVLYVSKDGEEITRVCIWGIAYELADITRETFLKALGFTIDSSDEYAEYYEIRDFNIIVNLFTFIESIKVSKLKEIVKAFEEAMSGHSGIDFVMGIEPFVLKCI